MRTPRRCHSFVGLWALTLILLAWSFTGCGDDDDDDNGGAVDDDDADDDAGGLVDEPVPGWSVWLTREGFVEFRKDGRVLFTLTGVTTTDFTPKSSMLFGLFKIGKDNPLPRPLQFRLDGDRLLLDAGGAEVGRLRASLTDSGSLRAEVLMGDGNAADSITLSFAMGASDKFWGFGEQYNFVDLRGLLVPVIVQEQGLGRRAAPLLPFEGTLVNSYFPMPYFLDPRKGKGFLLENMEPSLFDLGVTDKDRFSVEVYNGDHASFLVLPGPTAYDVVESLTAEFGRPERRPPDWAFSGAWIAAQGGTDDVRDRIDAALDAGVPVTAAWVQDWVGQRDFGAENFGVKYRWIPDASLYPGLETLIDDLAAEGVRFLGYFNPFIVPGYAHWDDAKEYGYTIKREDGSPYQFLISTFKGSLLDVTNADAVSYFQNFAFDALDLGMKGWMADFGEWLPLDAAIEEGSSWSEHNRYPTRWHRANRAVLDAVFPDGDYVLFTRSGFTGEQRVAQIVWAGDQETDWSAEDGFPTVMAAGLTMGMSGIPFFTHDIGGFSGGPRSKELFMRWTELGAFTPVMRTHDGLKKLENHHFDSDAETLAHFARMAKIHEALTPYWLALADEAVDSGRPMIRHTAFVDPEWDDAYRAHSQWMLGEDLIVAPVLEPGKVVVNVFLPQGTWENLFTGEEYDGRDIVYVDASLGSPAVLVRKGKLASIVEAVRGI